MNLVINTLDELLAHAHELEREAVERYEDLADQMEVHNQPELAELFHKMAAIEQQHVDKVESLAGSQPRPLAPWDYQWQTGVTSRARPWFRRRVEAGWMGVGLGCSHGGAPFRFGCNGS